MSFTYQIIQIKEENIKQHGDQLGELVSKSIKKHLSVELKNLAVSISVSVFSLLNDFINVKFIIRKNQIMVFSDRIFFTLYL